MPNKYQHNSERWLRNNAEIYTRMGSPQISQKMVLCADEVARLKEEVVALKVAVRLLIITTQPVLGEDGHLWVTQYALDALAALVGDE